MATFGQFGRGWYPEPIWDYTYNDDPLPGVPIPPNGIKEHNRFLELMALVAGLGRFEYNVQIEDRVNGVPGKQESPDFFIKLENGRPIGAEITRLTDPQRTAEWNLIEKLNAALAQALASDATLAKRYEAVSLSIQVRIREPKDYVPKALLAAILKRLSSKPRNAIRPQHIDRVRQHDDATLVQYSFSLVINERHSRWIEITPHIHTDPLDGNAALLERIADKIECSKKYDRRVPLWLVVPVADPWGQYSYELEEFENREYEIAPFERLIIANPARAISKLDITNASIT